MGVRYVRAANLSRISFSKSRMRFTFSLFLESFALFVEPKNF